MKGKWAARNTGFLLLILCILVTMIPSWKLNASQTEADKTFVVGFDAEFPPYGYKDDNGEYVGFDLDLAQEVCNRNGWILKKQPIRLSN